MRHLTRAVEFAVLMVRNFPLLAPHYLQDAANFNLEYPDPSKIIRTADKFRWYTASQPCARREPSYSKFLKLMEVTDLVLLDMKHIDSEVHGKLTGSSNANILEMARELDRLQKSVWIRHVVVPGWTDDGADLRRLRAFLETLHNIERIEKAARLRSGNAAFGQM